MIFIFENNNLALVGKKIDQDIIKFISYKMLNFGL